MDGRGVDERVEGYSVHAGRRHFNEVPLGDAAARLSERRGGPALRLWARTIATACNICSTDMLSSMMMSAPSLLPSEAPRKEVSAA